MTERSSAELYKAVGRRPSRAARWAAYPLGGGPAAAWRESQTVSRARAPPRRFPPFSSPRPAGSALRPPSRSGAAVVSEGEDWRRAPLTGEDDSKLSLK